MPNVIASDQPLSGGEGARAGRSASAASVRACADSCRDEARRAETTPRGDRAGDLEGGPAGGVAADATTGRLRIRRTGRDHPRVTQLSGIERQESPGRKEPWLSGLRNATLPVTHVLASSREIGRLNT